MVTPKCDVVVGADKLRVLRCVTEKVELAAPTCAIYNPLFATVLVAMGDTVRIYDAHTGIQTDFFPNLCKADISAVCLDDRKRLCPPPFPLHTPTTTYALKYNMCLMSLDSVLS